VPAQVHRPQNDTSAAAAEAADPLRDEDVILKRSWSFAAGEVPPHKGREKEDHEEEEHPAAALYPAHFGSGSEVAVEVEVEVKDGRGYKQQPSPPSPSPPASPHPPRRTPARLLLPPVAADELVDVDGHRGANGGASSSSSDGRWDCDTDRRSREMSLFDGLSSCEEEDGDDDDDDDESEETVGEKGTEQHNRENQEEEEEGIEVGAVVAHLSGTTSGSRKVGDAPTKSATTTPPLTRSTAKMAMMTTPSRSLSDRKRERDGVAKTPSFEREAQSFLKSAEKLERRRRMRDEEERTPRKGGGKRSGGKGVLSISLWSSLTACSFTEQISFKF